MYVVYCLSEFLSYSGRLSVQIDSNFLNNSMGQSGIAGRSEIFKLELCSKPKIEIISIKSLKKVIK